MKRNRTWLNLMLGLVLLVQGLAVAAAPRGLPDPATPGADVASMPAHCPAMAQPNDDSSAPARASCCDADCPDMTACVFGHLAAAIVIGPLEILQPDAFGASPAGPGPLARAPITPLRPPNPLHA